MLEECAWDPDVLATFAINADGEPLPADLAVKMRAAEDFGKGFDALTQMFYAALSYTYHLEPFADLTGRLVELQEQYSLFEYIPGTHMMANFGHLDGYSSGYYTYMWSLVIAKDMFSAFEGDLFNPDLAARYRDEVLAPGGRRDAAELVTQLLGRPYSLTAFRRRRSAAPRGLVVLCIEVTPGPSSVIELPVVLGNDERLDGNDAARARLRVLREGDLQRLEERSGAAHPHPFGRFQTVGAFGHDRLGEPEPARL